MSLPFFTIAIIHLQATRPARKAAMNPAANVIPEMSDANSGVSIKSFTLSNMAPMMGINTIRNENLVALTLSTPNNSAIAIVEPEREIPGIIATACAKPINNALT